MKILLKPHMNSHKCKEFIINSNPHEFYMKLLNNLYVSADKVHTQNIIFGDLIANPKRLGGDIWCGATNINSITAITLDFDDNVSIAEFCKRYGQYTHYGYTSYNHFKSKRNGGSDRFRVIIPLDRPVPMEYWGTPWIKKPLLNYFPGCDKSCFERGHWQLLPVAESVYKYNSWYNIGETFTLDILKTEMLIGKREYELMLKQKAFDISNRKFEADYDREAHITSYMEKYIYAEISELDFNNRGGGNNVNQRIGALFGRMMSHPKINFHQDEVADLLLAEAKDQSTIRDIKGWQNFFYNN